MAQPIVPPFGECFTELDDHLLWASIAQSLNILTGGSGGGGGGATPGTFVSNPQIVTASGSIPAGVKSWSFGVISGTVTLNGATIPIGAVVSGGGYAGFTMGSPLAYTITGGSVLLSYDS